MLTTTAVVLEQPEKLRLTQLDLTPPEAGDLVVDIDWSGRARTARELGALLAAAGFDRVRELATPIPLQVGVIVARRR